MTLRRQPSDSADPSAKLTSRGKGWRRVGGAMLIVAGAIVVLFVGLLISDWFNYQSGANSAPFWVFILGRVVTILVPGLLVGAIGWFAFWRRPLGSTRIPAGRE